MPISAMPDHLNTPEEIDAAFPDDEQFGVKSWWGRLYRWYNKKTKTIFAFSYRCHEWWARWRAYPKLLFAIGGRGAWRWEPVNRARPEIYDYNRNPKKGGQPAFYYLSRIQYYKRWHLAVKYATISLGGREWPIPLPLISFHFYPKASDVPTLGQPRPELDGKLWFFYWNHFDADLVYWMITSGYLGRNWK